MQHGDGRKARVPEEQTNTHILLTKQRSVQSLPRGRRERVAHGQAEKCLESNRKEIEQEAGSRGSPNTEQGERQVQGWAAG